MKKKSPALTRNKFLPGGVLTPTWQLPPVAFKDFKNVPWDISPRLDVFRSCILLKLSLAMSLHPLHSPVLNWTIRSSSSVCSSWLIIDALRSPLVNYWQINRQYYLEINFIPGGIWTPTCGLRANHLTIGNMYITKSCLVIIVQLRGFWLERRGAR